MSPGYSLQTHCPFLCCKCPISFLFCVVKVDRVSSYTDIYIFKHIFDFRSKHFPACSSLTFPSCLSQQSLTNDTTFSNSSWLCTAPGFFDVPCPLVSLISNLSLKCAAHIHLNVPTSPEHASLSCNTRKALLLDCMHVFLTFWNVLQRE